MAIQPRKGKAQKQSRYPECSDALLAYLEGRFPDTLPTEADATEKELLLRLGSRRVVDHLKAIKRRQDKEDSRNNVSAQPTQN